MVPLPSGTVTFLFTDIEGSTRLWDASGSAMRDAVASHDALMREAIEGHLAAQPVAYRTSLDQPDFTALSAFPFALDPYQLTRQEMAAFAVEARDAGVGYIGSCCGYVAAHVREMGRALGKVPEDDGTWRVDYDRPMSAFEYYRHSPDAER